MYIDNLLSTNFMNEILNILLIPSYKLTVILYIIYYIRIKKIEEKTEFMKLLSFKFLIVIFFHTKIFSVSKLLEKNTMIFMYHFN